jgi:hypothetical protein
MNLDETLVKLTSIIEEYKSGAWLDKDRLRELLRELSSYYYLVTKENIEAYEKWNYIIYTRPIGESVAAAKVRADEKCTELRMTRKILEASKQVLLSMQQELSILKKD